MSIQYIGKQSIKFNEPPFILSSGCVVGEKESEGPLGNGIYGNTFDLTLTDPMCGRNSWEEAESELQYQAANIAIEKSGLNKDNIRYIYGGDLLGQNMATSFGVGSMGIATFGLYGACSTMGESLCLGAMNIAGGFAENVLAIASSHYASAEKTFRFPLGYGAQRKMCATWTVTGSGAVIVSNKESFAKITAITPGKIIDYDVKDKENMGAAMAPAACDTIYTHLTDLNLTPDYYDKIVTGDLGYVGQTILFDLMEEKGFDITKVHMDCGIEIFDKQKQDTHSGGSGCGCSAVVLCGHLLNQLQTGELKRILFLPTGALLSPSSSNEGLSIPSIAHAVAIERVDCRI